MSSTSTIRSLLAATLAASLAVPAQALPFNIGGLEGQFDSQLTLTSRWATDSAGRALIGASNGGRAPAASGDDGRLNFKRGETFSKRFSGWHGVELRSGATGAFVSGRYWYDFELKDEARPFAAIDDHGRERGAQASGAEWLEAFAWHNHAIGEQPGSLRLGRQQLHWGEGVLIPGGIDVINPFDAAIWRRADAPLNEGRLPVSLLHGAQELGALSLEAFYQLEWRATTLDDCATFLARADYLADGCNQLARPAGTPLPRGADRDARDSGQFGLALHYHFEQLATEFGAYLLNYHSRLPLLGVAEASYFLAYPEDIRLYGLSFATTLAGGSVWRGEFSHRPDAPLQPSIGDGLAAGQAQPAWRRRAVSQLQTSLEHHFDQVMGASRLSLVGELAWIRVGDLDGRDGRDPLFGPGPQADGDCPLPAGASGRYCENDGFTSRDAWGYRLQAVWEYPRVFAGIDLAPRLAWAHDVEGHSPAPEATFVEGRQAFSLGLDADYRDTYSASLAYTEFFGGEYSTLVDRDYLSLTLGLRF